MLLIRKQQMEALDRAAVEGFERQMLEHAKEAFPKHCAILGEAAVARVVESATGKARSYQVLSMGGQQLFLDLTFLLGGGFDDDPQLPWAGSILRNNLPEDARLDQLFDKAMAYLERVSGPDNEHIDEAQRRIREESTIDLPATVADNIEEYLLSRLRWIWPQKYADVQEHGLRKLIRDGLASAKRSNIATNRGVLTLIGLKFLLGNGVESDPQFPWVAAILGARENQGESQGPHERADRLFKAAFSYLDQWCG